MPHLSGRLSIVILRMRASTRCRPRAVGVSAGIRAMASSVIRNQTCLLSGTSSAPNQKVPFGSRVGSRGVRAFAPPGQSSCLPPMTIANSLPVMAYIIRDSGIVVRVTVVRLRGTKCVGVATSRTTGRLDAHRRHGLASGAMCDASDPAACAWYADSIPDCVNDPCHLGRHPGLTSMPMGLTVMRSRISLESYACTIPVFES